MSSDAIAILSSTQRATLVAALNRIIPAEGELPGAGDLGGAEMIERRLAAPVLRRAILTLLAELDVAAWQSADRPFEELAAEQQDHVLRKIEASAPALFDLLVHETYRAYYVDPRVLTLLGLEARPPQPLGHTLPRFDPSLLDAVRRRDPLYRAVEPSDK